MKESDNSVSNRAFRSPHHNVVEVVRIRIDSLGHTRTLVTIAAGIFTGLSVGSGVTARVLRLSMEADKGANLPLQDAPWGFDPFVVVYIVLTDLFFLLAVFMLTDAIHNYSKSLEHAEPALYPAGGEQSVRTHQRALAADDLSYFFVRWGLVFLIAGFVMCVPATLGFRGGSQLLHIAVAAVCLAFAFLLVFACYRVSHCTTANGGPVRPAPAGTALKWFVNPNRWIQAAQAAFVPPSSAADENPSPMDGDET